MRGTGYRTVFFSLLLRIWPKLKRNAHKELSLTTINLGILMSNFKIILNLFL